MDIFAYTVIIDNTERHLLSLIRSEDAFQNGLKGKSVIGYLKNPEGTISKENVSINPEFVKLFQEVIRMTAQNSESLTKSAKQQNSGYIYIIDQRAISNPDTKPYDIIGAFEVKNGNIIAESYQANSNYEIISIDGLFKLPPEFEQNILNAVHI